MGVKCFMITRSDRANAYTRRYSVGKDKCNGKSYHDAKSFHSVVAVSVTERNSFKVHTPNVEELPRDLFPTKCEKCDYQFLETDEWQCIGDIIYTDEAGCEYSLRNPPPGAMWYANWYEHWLGPDGHCLAVQTPGGGPWLIDSPASNCTKPGDTEHKCWVRHGVAPMITVDKDGPTCSAGAGSIVFGDYHGFLRNGEFT